MIMAFDINTLADKSPKQLLEMKRAFLDLLNFRDAAIVSDYMQHCINTSRLVKKIVNE